MNILLFLRVSNLPLVSTLIMHRGRLNARHEDACAGCTMQSECFSSIRHDTSTRQMHWDDMRLPQRICLREKIGLDFVPWIGQIQIVFFSLSFSLSFFFFLIHFLLFLFCFSYAFSFSFFYLFSVLFFVLLRFSDVRFPRPVSGFYSIHSSFCFVRYKLSSLISVFSCSL